TPGDDRALRHLLRMGNAPDAVVVRKDKAYKVFGPKVISWIQAPEDAALTSRCIPIQMFQSSDPKLARVNDRDVEEDAARLRNRLLMFRFERYDKITTVRTPGDDRLTPRMRDLFESLAVVCEDNEHRGMLLDLFKLDNVFVKEPLPPEQDAVLSALFVKI